jgi:hypothetical protein
MSQATRTNITSPVGRVVMGNLYQPNTTDAEGKPLVIKTGPNAGKPRSNYFFALAIPKGPEPHWAHTPWGGQIWQVGNLAFPQAAQSPAFAWKIEDGDSQVPNKRGRKPFENEGWKGHWILKLSGGFAPKVYRQEGQGYLQEMTVDFVKPGYFVEVAFNVDGNDSQSQPGVYLNHSMVCFRGYGPEIVFGPDVNEAGFGKAPLPAGASMVPLAGAIPLPGASAAPAYPLMPSVPAAVATQAGMMASAGIASPMPPIAVIPNPQFLQVPPPTPPAVANTVLMPAIPAALPAVPASAYPSRTMTAKAAGASYQAFTAAGWTDANLIANGYMTA